jgi:hypothetical protein
MSNRIQTFISVDNGIRLEPSAPNTQSQNGGAERSGGVIKEKARAMRLGSKLPAFLWVEIVRSAVYLYNRTPKYIYNWMSPYERFFTFLSYRDGLVVKDRKPSQQHLKAYGCKAFAMTSNAQLKSNRKQRLNPKAFIGYLVGYNSTNIYRIWNPVTNRVIITRDVLFNESEFFSGDIQHMKDDLLHITNEEIEALLHSVEIQSISEPPESGSTNHFEDEELYMAVREVIPDNQIESDLEDTIVVDPSLYYQTPEHTPVRPGALLAIAIRNAGQPLINSQSLAQGEVLQEDYTNLSTNPCSSNTKYRN